MHLQVTPAEQSTRMLFTTVRITAKLNDNSIANGTGFFYSSGRAEYLITNKHVIEDAISITFTVHKATKDHPQYVLLGQHKEYSTNPNDWLHHTDPEIDLCCLPVKHIFNNINKDDYFYISISSESIVNDAEILGRMPASIGVAMIGYPNGLWDEANGLPIIRKGTTASHPFVPFNNRDEIVLDMACFPGSSGSPVMYYEPNYFASAQKFLGILYAGPTINTEGHVLVSKIPTSNSQRVSIQTMMHLGYVITGKKIQEFILEIENTTNSFESR